MPQRIRTHRDLDVWSRSIDLVVGVYRLTKSFPREERYGLTAQLRRAAVSIPSNIAEGAARGSRNEYHRFVSIARGSAAEVETLLEVSERLAFVSSADLTDAKTTNEEVSGMLTVLRKKLGGSSDG